MSGLVVLFCIRIWNVYGDAKKSLARFYLILMNMLYGMPKLLNFFDFKFLTSFSTKHPPSIITINALIYFMYEINTPLNMIELYFLHNILLEKLN